jgi:hypothetical protein
VCGIDPLNKPKYSASWYVHTTFPSSTTYTSSTIIDSDGVTGTADGLLSYGYNPHGIFSNVNQDVGEIIVADVNQARIAELLAPDRTALQKLIRKQD